MATRNVYMHTRKVYGTCLLLILILGMVASAGGAAATPSTCAPPPAGMVAWYPGDDNSEDIAGDNDGTLQNGATFTGGKVDQAFSFDGVDDYVLVPDHPSLDSPTAVSVDVWMRATNGNGFQGLVSKFEHYTHPATDDAYNISIENGTIRWQIVAGPLLDFQLNTPVLPIFDGEWHLLAGTYDSTAQRMVLYVDGIEVASARAYGLISDVNTPLYLGASKTYGANAYYFHGQLDEVEVFNRALTAAEVLSIYNAGSAGKCKNANPPTSTAVPTDTETATAIPTSTSTEIPTETATAIATDTATSTPLATETCAPAPAGMVAWYPGDNTPEDIAGDNEGTLQNGATFTTGMVDQAFSFDGIDDYVLVPDHPSLDPPTAVSVDVWMKATSGNGFQGLVSKFEHYTHPAIDDAYNIAIENGTIRWQVVAGQRDFQLNTAVLPIFDGEWHLLAGTYDSMAQRMVIYVDGVEVASQTAYGIISDINTPLYLGASKTYGANAHYFHGQLDEVEVFNRALTAMDVQSIYNAGRAGKCKDANTATSTATSTWTATAIATSTSTEIPTETATASATATATSTPLATGTCVPPPASMVAWYPGDNTPEDIAGDNDGTLQNGATFTTGKVDQALSFDGVDDYVLVPDDPALDVSTAVSVDVWMRATSSSNFRGLVSKFDHNNGTFNDDAYNLAIQDGTIRWQIVAEQRNFQVNTGLLPIFDGEYHLLAGTYDSATQRMVIYVDGVEVASRIAFGTISDVSTPLYLGAAKDLGVNTHYFNGQLDEVEIFNRALTAADVQSIYDAGSAGKCKATSTATSTAVPTDTETATAIATATATSTAISSPTESYTSTHTATATSTPLAPSTCASPPAGMVAWYPGDDNSEDIAGNNDGTLQNGATFTTGKVAQAFSFDGVDDYVLVPDHPSLDPPMAVSVDVWMKSTNGNGFQGLVSKFEHYTHPAIDDAYNIAIENGTIRWQVVAGLRDFQLNTPVLPIFDSEWHLLAGTYDSMAQRMVIYVDGVEVASQTAYGTISDINTPLYLGATKTYGANAHYFNGQLDEVEIFNRALTAADVQSIYNAGSAGKCKNANPATSTATSTETAISIPTSTLIPTYTETATAIATATATNTPTATNTASHTATATSTATSTPANTFGYVTGRGEMHHTQNNDIFAFRFNAKSDAEGIKANCSVADNGEGIHISCLDATVFVQNGNHVTFAGNALINGAPVTYRIDVEDNGEPGKGRDIFTIQLSNGYTASGLLTQGNIQVHR